MRFHKTFIPYGGYWSTPFARWQGSLSRRHPVELAAETTRRALAERSIQADGLDGLVFGTTVPSPQSFYAGPWLAGLVGAPGITGPTIMQACATSARVMADAAMLIEAETEERAILGVTADRTSNGPHVYYPDPGGPGGRGLTEDWVWDNFQNDPFADTGPMLATAENVAVEQGISREEQDELTLLRYEQYLADRQNGLDFVRRYMLLPLEVRDASGRKVLAVLDDDEGITPTSAEGLASLKPVRQGGSVTYGSQTHPADGACGFVLAGRERAREMSRDRGIEIQLLGFGQARAKKGFMPLAPVPAARAALEAAQLRITDIAAIKTHNPFAVNDVHLSRSFDIPPEAFNNHGSSLVFGHPQGPTGMRLVMELIEELADRGGGHGLFTGCAAGDTGAALVVRVDSSRA